MDKRRLLFDSRFAPPSPVTRDVVTVYALTAGELATADATVATRGLWVMAETELERPVPGARWFRSWGERSVAVELRVARALEETGVTDARPVEIAA